MQLREYKSADCEQLADLFYQTVHSVNAEDYTKEQLDAWATGEVDLQGWGNLLQKGMNYVKIEYKRLTEKELSTFIDMRINQLREEGAKEEIDLVPALKEYYIRHMADGTFVSWLAFDGENIIGTSGMSFVEKPPYFGCPSGKLGLLSSMYTNPDYRRKGIAKELLSRVVNDAREYGCGTIQITASDMGVKLYSDFGFVHNGNFMQYKLQYGKADENRKCRTYRFMLNT